jgi:F-type H+-transporting ATPase subunit b
MQRGFKQAAQKEIEMARKEADDLRVQLVKEARQEGESARSQWLQTVEQEKKAFLEQTTRAIVLHFEQLASAVLQNLADEGLEKKILATFLCKIDLLPPEDLQGLREAAAAGEPVVITSAFSGSEAVRAEINRYCAQVLSPDALVQFREDTKLVAGIHLTVGNKKICWDIQQYLKEFHDSLSKSLDLEMLR